MEMEFDVKVTAGVLYDYLLYHTYTSFSGMIGTLVGVILIIKHNNRKINKIFYLSHCRRCADCVSSGSAVFESDETGTKYPCIQKAAALQNDRGRHQCISGRKRGKPELGQLCEGSFDREKHHSLYIKNSRIHFSEKRFGG